MEVVHVRAVAGIEPANSMLLLVLTGPRAADWQLTALQVSDPGMMMKSIQWK